jgi:hypothetical protein
MDGRSIKRIGKMIIENGDRGIEIMKVIGGGGGGGEKGCELDE